MQEGGVVPMDISNYAWGRRALDPNQPFIDNGDGTHSTHRMAAEQDDKGNWWAFPTIVMLPTGELKHFDSNDEAMQWNIANHEAVAFGEDKDAALRFAEGAYKQGTPLSQ